MESNVNPASNSSPEETLSTTDTGDDVQRRYRYQATYTAIVALDLLYDDTEFEELFCEHHEDILVKKKDGTFIGIQVKTRILGREPFKSTDEDVLHSLKRFVEHEISYPGHYSRFVLATNHGFWTAVKKSKGNLRYILQLAESVCYDGSSEMPNELSKYLDRLKGLVNSDCTRELVLQMLCKLELRDDLPRFDDIELRLAKNIPNCYDIGEARLHDLLVASRNLINKMLEANSLTHTSPRECYFALCMDPQKNYGDSVIQGKRITRETVISILEESLSADVLLSTIEDVLIEDLPKGVQIMERKMAMGNISYDSIRLAKDYKYSADKLFSEWLYKYNPKVTRERYQQMSLIAGTECQEVYDVVNREDEPFGQEMLNDIRQRLRTRHKEEPSAFFNCRYEHLLGIVGILTEACDVWWSKEHKVSEYLA